MATSSPFGDGGIGGLERWPSHIGRRRRHHAAESPPRRHVATSSRRCNVVVGRMLIGTAMHCLEVFIGVVVFVVVVVVVALPVLFLFLFFLLLVVLYPLMVLLPLLKKIDVTGERLITS